MKIAAALVWGLVTCVSAARLHAATDDEVTARNLALLTAGAFAEDAFKLRDGNWTGTFEMSKPKVIQVNLYAGNQYWFTLGATKNARKVSVSVFDENGKAMESLPYQKEDAPVAAAGFAPEASGSYYVKVEETEGQPASFCLIYSYK